MTIDQLNLAPLMKQRASELQTAHPSVQFLSGRRDIQSQAHAMATQVVDDRDWIVHTYKHATLLQTAVDFYEGPWTIDGLSEKLAQTMYGMSADELSRISDHLQGNAVDLVPMEEGGVMTGEGSQVTAFILNCPDTKQFLMREGGKVIWHWSCHASAAI